MRASTSILPPSCISKVRSADLEHLDAVDAAHRGGHPLDVLLGAAVDEHVLVEVGAARLEAADGGDVAAGLTDGGGQPAERAGPVVEPDAEADRVRGGGGGHGGWPACGARRRATDGTPRAA